MTRIVGCIIVVALLAAPLFGAPPSSADSDKVWAFEKAYWEYVKANDLAKYRTLWNSDFLGWPSVSAEPLGKEHITDWITSHTSKGEKLKSYDLEQLTSKVTGNYATTAYRIRITWVDKTGAGQPSSVRIIHTWLRNGGNWQIISGMSAPTNAEGH